MKHLIKTLVNAIIAAAALAAAAPAAAQTGTQPEPIVVDGCRPLLAPDCVVDDVVESLSALADKADYSAVLDNNLTNYASVKGLLNTGLLHDPIISIRDLKNKYAGGQQVGFVINSGSKLLDVNVLKFMTIQLYNDNKIVELDQSLVVGENGIGALSLNLLATSGTQTIVVNVPEKDKYGNDVVFDEIMLCGEGINADVLSSGTQIYYGFVGKNTEYKLQNGGKDTFTSEHYAVDNIIGAVPYWRDNDFADGGTFRQDGGLLSYLVNFGFKLRLSYGKDENGVQQFAPKNVELGFVYNNTDILNIDLLKHVSFLLENTVTGESRSYDINSQFLSVTAINHKDDARYTVNVESDFVWNRVTLQVGNISVLGKLLGETIFKYAYIKKFEAPQMERHNLNLSADALICSNQQEYTLTSNEKVTWTLAEAKQHDGTAIANSGVTIYPDDAAKSATVNFNQSPEGVYTFKATHDHGDGTSCTGTVTITRGKTDGMLEATAKAFCGTPLDAFADNVEIGKGSGGGLIVIDGLENADNIIDGDLNSYASYARGLQIADNTCIVKVSKTDGSKFDAGQAAVVGFVAETPTQLLGASVLTFYRIVLYNDGEEVYSEVTGQNDGVNVSLIGAPGSGMVRYAITVPTEHRGRFDGFALYTSGVLNLDLTDETMKIYNAFTADEGCAVMPAGPLDHAGVRPISIDDGATINYKYTGSMGLASVVSVTEGLGYLIDNELINADKTEKGVTAYTVAGVLNGSGLAVRTGRRYGGGRWVGLVMKKGSGLADVNLLSDMSISLYDNSVSTGDEEGTGVQLLSANVIGWGDYAYLTVYTDKPFDEVRFEKGQLIEALSGLEYLGFYTYADADGDGIPDEEDPDFCEDDIVIDFGDPTVSGDINGICASNADDEIEATVTATDAAKVVYTISDIDRKKVVTSGELSNPANGKFTHTISIGDKCFLDNKDMPAYGRYEFKVSLPDNPLFTPGRKQFTIHAVQTQWAPQLVLKQDAQAEGGDASTAVAGEYEYSRDWNAWENWTQGVPVIGCTDVVIPGNAPSFPVLEEYAGTGTEPKDFNSCGGIHFMAGAEAQNTDYLDYDKVWVDLELSADRYYMLSAPLTGMVTGDFFVPAAMNGTQDNDLFTDLTPAASPENRFSPRVYQRLWLCSAPVNNGATGTASETYDETKWTPPFNALNQKYERGMGFSLKAAAEDLSVTKLKFRFPKTHTEYYYYNEKKQQTDIKETVDRDGAGRLFGFDKGKDEMTVNLTTDEAGNVFLAGNPFMAHINIKKFLEANPGVTGVKVYDGNANNSAILCDGDLLTNADGWTSIAPMQSFFVTTDGDASTSCSITFTRAMLEQQPGGGQPLRVSQSRAAGTAADGGRLVIRAKAGGVESTALVRFSDGASAGFVPGEDASLLVDDEVRPRVQVFTLAGGRAADIQQTPCVDRLTLGLMTAAGGSLTLSLSGDTDWTLYDTLTGATYPMDGGTEVDLGPTGSSTGRYMLVRDASAIAGGLVPDGGVVINRTQQGTLAVTSADGTTLKSCKVYSADGTLVDSADGEAPSLELRAARGVSIVAVAKADGTGYTQKIY